MMVSYPQVLDYTKSMFNKDPHGVNLYTFIESENQISFVQNIKHGILIERYKDIDDFYNCNRGIILHKDKLAMCVDGNRWLKKFGDLKNGWMDEYKGDTKWTISNKCYLNA